MVVTVRFILLFKNVSLDVNSFLVLLVIPLRVAVLNLVFFSIVCAMVMVVIVVRVLVVFIELCGLWSVWHAGGCVVVVAVSMVQVP